MFQAFLLNWLNFEEGTIGCPKKSVISYLRNILEERRTRVLYNSCEVF
jgi:hypothetical protein